MNYKVNGISIEIGQELYHGTTIDLVVGKGLSNEKIHIPNLLGLSRIEANIVLKSASLNIGLEYFNNEVSDSNNALFESETSLLKYSRPIFNEADFKTIFASILESPSKLGICIFSLLKPLPTTKSIVVPW